MLYGRCCRITVKKSIEWYKVGSSGQLKMMQPLLQPVVAAEGAFFVYFFPVKPSRKLCMAIFSISF